MKRFSQLATRSSLRQAALVAVIGGTVLGGVNMARSESVSGTIERFTKAPRGEVDGAVLSDGTYIHWPPHTGADVSDKFKKGDRIEAVGDKEKGPEGDSRIEVQTLKSASGDVSVDIAAIGPPRGGPRGPRERGEQKTVRGVVERFTTAPRGEIDGAQLDSGTLLHWPPHMGDRMQEVLAKGDRVEAIGSDESGPKGDRHFEVERVTNLKRDRSLSVEPPRKKPKPGREHGESTTFVSGIVRRLTKAPKGEVDGAVLDDGTVLHWPPNRESDFVDLAKVGQKVRVSGWPEVGPDGDKRVEVDSIDSGSSGDNGNRNDRLSSLEEQLKKIQAEIDELRRH